MSWNRNSIIRFQFYYAYAIAGKKTKNKKKFILLGIKNGYPLEKNHSDFSLSKKARHTTVMIDSEIGNYYYSQSISKNKSFVTDIFTP